MRARGRSFIKLSHTAKPLILSISPFINVKANANTVEETIDKAMAEKYSMYIIERAFKAYTFRRIGLIVS